MKDDQGYLFSEQDSSVLKNLSTMGEELKKLYLNMLQKEAEYDQAKKEYEYYANTILPMEMFQAGISSVELMSGGKLQYERKFYCQPNKNEADKKIIADWLRQHGGDHLVKERAVIDIAQVDKLRDVGIPYSTIEDFNTASLKAFIKDKLGATGGVAQIEITDVPACAHFQEVGVVAIDV
jgi:hypothetical protein